MASPHPAMLWGTAGEECDTRFVVVAVFQPLRLLTPSPCGYSPYIPLRKHRGRGLKSSLFPYAVFASRNAAGHGRGEFDTLFCCCRCFLTPPSSGHLPYILLRKTQGRCVRCISFSLLLRFYIRHLVRLLGTAGEEVKISFR